MGKSGEGYAPTGSIPAAVVGPSAAQGGSTPPLAQPNDSPPPGSAYREGAAPDSGPGSIAPARGGTSEDARAPRCPTCWHEPHAAGECCVELWSQNYEHDRNDRVTCACPHDSPPPVSPIVGVKPTGTQSPAPVRGGTSFAYTPETFMLAVYMALDFASDADPKDVLAKVARLRQDELGEARDD